VFLEKPTAAPDRLEHSSHPKTEPRLIAQFGAGTGMGPGGHQAVERLEKGVGYGG